MLGERCGAGRTETAVEVRDSNPLRESIHWLEEEHRLSKAAAFKVQQQVDQLQAALWAQGDRMHALEQALAVISGQGVRITKLEDDLRQAHELIDRLQEFQSAQNERWTAADRARFADQDRERQELAQIFQKLEQLERDVAFVRSRTQSMDEIQRRIQDALVELGQRIDNLGQIDETLASRLQAVSELVKRKDVEISRLDGELDALRKQDELALNRIQVLGEQVRRVEDLGPLRDLGTRLEAEFNEKLELHRVERQRMERTVLEIELLLEQHRTRLDELAQHTTQVETKSNAQADYVTQLREQVWALRDEMIAQLGELFRMEEQQKRRQMADIEQQLLELKNRSARALPRPS